MQSPHEILPRGRSPFAAAFLSLVFPGLGHAYLGAYRRGLGFAAPPLLAAALIAGFAVRMTAFDLAGLAVQNWFQIAVFIGNLVALAYRAGAIVDAWSIARRLGGRATVTVSASIRAAGMTSLAGLMVVLLVMSGVHVAVARYDLVLAGTSNCIFNQETDCAANGSPNPSGAEDTSEPVDSGNPSIGPAASGNPIPQWNGTDRLNILLIGADEQGGGHRTDTMITVSIDPKSGEVVMFTLPRDTVDVPVPPGAPRNVWGATYSAKINSFLSSAAARPDAFPGTKATRGYTGLKAILGNLYGLNIQYYVEVNFSGFEQVVDALGGVTVNVQVPVLDDNFPEPGAHRERLYVAAGMQHMTGSQALEYARSRESTSDFDRGARQQRLLVSLRQQLDIGQALQNLDTLAAAIGQSVRTDIPREIVPQLLGLAAKVNTKSIRSVIFTPPYYQTECMNCPPRGYILEPHVSLIRQAVADAFNVDPTIADTREALAEEAAQLWVLNGSGRSGEAARLADYLNYLGMAATAPTQKPGISPATTTIRAYNGAVDKFPQTVAELQKVFAVTVVPTTDPSVHVDFIVITGTGTPELTPPPVP